MSRTAPGHPDAACDGVTREQQQYRHRRCEETIPSDQGGHCMFEHTMKLSNLRIGVRLAAAFAALLVFLAASTTLGIARMAGIQDYLHNVSEEHNAQIDLVTGMRTAVLESAIGHRNLVLLQEAAAVQAEVERVQGQEALFKRAHE
ncbi:MAG TPA: MCP four helix bundle domain-containing protein, partial [Ramlibacter sp.]